MARKKAENGEERGERHIRLESQMFQYATLTQSPEWQKFRDDLYNMAQVNAFQVVKLLNAGQDEEARKIAHVIAGMFEIMGYPEKAQKYAEKSLANLQQRKEKIP